MKKIILVIGATGYVGGRLVLSLLDRGYRVRAVGRSHLKLQGRSWSKHPNIELCAADATNLEQIQKAINGCHIIYYLAHSMSSGEKSFSELDRLAAQNVVHVAQIAQVQRIIYLGALGDKKDNTLSCHLRSREEVAKIFRHSDIPFTILRAGMIIGSGSVSFEMLRYLVDRQPIMIAPKRIHTPCQPISIRNVIEYLVRCIDTNKTINQTFDIGGEVATYYQLIRLYAKEAHLLHRIIIPIPWMPIILSYIWIKLLTPLPLYYIKPLVEGIRNPVLCLDHRIKEIIPQKIFNCQESIQLAVDRLNKGISKTSWMDAGKITPVEWVHSDDPKWAGGTIYEYTASIKIKASTVEIWNTLITIGGHSGWYYGNWLWKLRGWMDDIFGGVGARRGRRNKTELYIGDALDLWRVYRLKRYQKLMLVAEMKLPGEAVLEFHLNPIDEDEIELVQYAKFLPYGLLGILYWYLVTPLHSLVFNGMVKAIKKKTLERRVNKL